jgi:spermidine synthase
MNFRTPSGRTTRTLLLVLFFLSGACGLVYQVVWQRLLCLIFGNTTFATATVLAAFMGGLALGSFLLGGFADRTKNPLRLYAVLQFGIGVLALLMPLLLSITGAVNTILYHRLSANYPLFTLIRFLLCFGVLLLPTALMGGTLPAISKYFVKNLKGLGRSVGSLYGINTFGAVAGCLLTGFFLIAAIGVRHTTLLAALTNMAIAATAFLLSRAPSPSQATQEKPPPAKSDKHRKEGQSDRAYPRYIAPLILIIYALSGFCALTYEVLWTRALVFFFGSTTFAFTTMLATFLFGLAIGSTLFARYAGRRKHLLPLLGILEILIGLFALLSIWEFSELEGLLTRLRASLGGNWWAFTAGRFAGGFIIMLIPTVLMGAVFPLVSRIVTRSVKNLGGSIGKVYGANTLGCIFGALLAGFLIIPLVGITQGIMGIAFLNIALGGLVLSLHPSGGLKLKSGAFAVTALLIVSGAFALKDQKPITLSCGMFKDLHKGGKLLYYEEATAGTITVHSIAPSPSEHKPPKFIEVDGLDVAGTNLELQTTQKLQGHLPVLLYKSMNERSPQKCFIVAFGSGASTYETSLHPEIGHIRGVEINPSVVKAAPHFAELNHNVLENPRYHLAMIERRSIQPGFFPDL